MAFTPGPNNIMIMTSGLNHGIRASLPQLAGIALGVPTMFIAVGLGLGVVFEMYPQLHGIVKIIGTLYLIYLAWQISQSSAGNGSESLAKPFTFLQTMLFQWVNPKSWILVTTSIATFTAIGEHVLYQVIIMSLFFVLIGFLSAGTWLCFGYSLKTLLKKTSYRRVFNIAMAVLLLVSILPITLEIFDFS